MTMNNSRRKSNVLLRHYTFLFALTFSRSLFALGYIEITEIPNPYRESDITFSDLNSDEAIRHQAASERFDMCQSGVINVVGYSRNRVTLDKYEKRDEAFWKKMWAGSLGNEYPFDMTVVASDGDAAVSKLIVEMAWDNPVNSDADVDPLANKFWKSCLLLPIKAFVGDLEEDE